MKKILCIVFECLRWIVVIVSLQLAYSNFQSLENVFPLVVFLTVFTIASLSGTESLFLSEEAQRITGYKPSGYQRQSGLFFYALALTSTIVFTFKWGVKSSLVVLVLTLILLLLSSINHLYSALKEDNGKFRNIYLRFVGTILLVGSYLPVIINIL
ncbi:MAG: hypothetical protein KAH01_07880 [Caldisericia bacterium]|nr:hypothetical protein [Caldisericia bacterium]